MAKGGGVSPANLLTRKDDVAGDERCVACDVPGKSQSVVRQVRGDVGRARVINV